MDNIYDKKQTPGSTRLSDFLDPKLIFPGSRESKLFVSLENIEIWNAEAEALFDFLKDATILDAVRYIEKHQPSAGVVALLSFVAKDKTKSEQGKSAVRARLDKDPKQKEKTSVFECWQKWQKKPNNYKSKAAFARDMLDKFEHLTSQKKIEDWCREWKEKSRTLPAK